MPNTGPVIGETAKEILMPGYANNILSEVNALMDEIVAGANKTASVKKKAEEEAGGSGSAGKDPGGYMGKTTHPSGKADAGTQAAPVGSRGQENKSDVKKDVPNSVEDHEVNKADSDNNQIQIGTKKSPTGEDPAVEDAYKGTKDDERDGDRGGTAGPFNAEEVGEKYSSMQFTQLYKIACDKANKVLAKLANGEKTAASKAQAPATKTAAAAVTQVTEPTSAEAAAAGYELAKLAAAFGTTPDDDSVIKFAAAQRVVANFIQEGFEAADATGEYLYKLANYQDEFAKAAEGEMPPGMPPGMPAGGADITGGEPGPGGDMGGGGGMPPEMGAEMPGTGAGMPPGAGGDPGAGAGPGAGGAGGEVPDEAINELANAFIDAGIPVEKLIAALQGAAGGGGGGAPPEAGPGAGPEAKEAAARYREVLQDVPALKNAALKVANHLKAGKFKMKRPADQKTAAERTGAVNYLSYIKEVFSI